MDEEEYNPQCYLPQRYIMTAMVFLAILSSYTLRVSMDVAMRHMVKPVYINETDYDPECGFNDTIPVLVPVNYKFFDWDDETKDYFSIAFFWGYIMGHLPGGIWSDKYGGGRVIKWSILTIAILEMITPQLLIMTDGNYFVLIIMRALIGFSAGMIFPSTNSIIANWAPKREKGRLGCTAFSAAQFAIVVNDDATNILINASGAWSSSFYVYGGFMLGWCFFWHFLGSSTPKQSTSITHKELVYIETQTIGHVTFGKKRIPWKKMLTSFPLWVLICSEFGHDWLWHVMLNDLPNYMRRVLKFDIKTSDYVSSLPYTLMGCCTFIHGFCADFLINRNYVHRTTLRKMYTTFGAMGPAVFIVAASYTGCRRDVAVANFILAMGLMSCYYPGARMITLELAPNFSGTIMALVNGIGAVAALLAPVIVHLVSPTADLDQWQRVFWSFLLISALTNLVFIILGTPKEQPWNSVPDVSTSRKREGTTEFNPKWRTNEVSEAKNLSEQL